MSAKTVLITFVILVSYSFSISKDKVEPIRNVKPNRKDTASAVVGYGQGYLFESAQDLSAAEFELLLDSILKDGFSSNELIHEINFYKSLKNKSHAAICAMTDSLLLLDSIPYNLINPLNLYTALHPKELEVPLTYSFVNSDTSFYPANTYYNRWNNRVAWDYPSSISENDSIEVLLLKENENEYHHPIGAKTLRRYFGWVTSPFGWRDGRAHNGVDLELHYWDSIYCMFPGKIRMARTYSDYGKVVVVRHKNGLETLYAHMSKTAVKEGQLVKAGELLGHGGKTGNATGTHLHLEIRFKGLPINPAHIVSFKNKEVHADTLVLKKMKHTYIAFPSGTDFHTVKRGEYPSKVAKRYGITTEKLCLMNEITRKTRLSVGQKLRIKDN
ncbi:MAG: M23 family metallopeptidase [Flavobacteriales bacterium]|nr:M23 family metallopeptidase [Flavobacteriales bacterium]